MTYTFKNACPYCGGDVEARETGWTHEDDGTETVDSIDADCQTMPRDTDSEEWEEWMEIHSDMPYVHWMPFENRMIRAINRAKALPYAEPALPENRDKAQLLLF